MIKFGTDYSKLKKNLKLACARLKILQAKRLEQNEKLKLEIANFLKSGKYVQAKIKTQKIINEKASAEGMELVRMYCEELLEKYDLFEQRKSIDITLRRTISSLIWSAPYYQTQVPELEVIAKQMTIKYGPRYIKKVLENEEGTVDPELITRVIMVIPSDETVEKCLKNICLKYSITYTKSEESVHDKVQNIEKYGSETSYEISQEGEFKSSEGRKQLNLKKITDVPENPACKELDKFPKGFKNMFRLRNLKKSKQNPEEANKGMKDVSGYEGEEHQETLIPGKNQQINQENSTLASENNNDLSFNSTFSLDYNNQMNDIKKHFSEKIPEKHSSKVENTSKCSLNTPITQLSQTHNCHPSTIYPSIYNEPPPSYDSIYFNDLRTVSDHILDSDEIIDSIQLPSCPTEEPEVNSSSEDLTVKPNTREKNNFWNN